MQVSGSTFFVTGGASGLGAACVSRLHAAGARVVVADTKVADPVTESSSVVCCRVDVTNSQEVAAALQIAVERFGALHGVVSCAGILGAARVLGRDGPHDLELFRRVIEVNLIGTFNVLRLAAEKMAGNAPNSDGERGVVINTSSVAAF